MAAVALWLATVELLSLATLPLTYRLFRALPDHGHGLSKMLGLAAVGYVSWLLSMLGFTAFDRGAVIVLAAAVAAACWWSGGSGCLESLRSRWPVLLAAEGLFLAALGVGVFVRAFNPDIVGQEKFMDLAFMNAFLATSDLPTDDPWLAGFGLAYYHLGYLVLGIPAKIAGIPPATAYNLAVAFVFAATFGGAVTLAYALVSRTPPEAVASLEPAPLGFGILAGGMVALFGNLAGPLELVAARGWGDADLWRAIGIRNLAPSVSGGLLPSEPAWWWRSSRVIPNIEPDGITEFPYFSFLLGDLHPHYMALPLDLVLVGLALVVWRQGLYEDGLLRTAVASAALGLLVGTNTWDVPTFWGLLLSAGALHLWWRAGDRSGAVRGLPMLLAPFLLAPLAIGPYFVGYQAPPLGLGIVAERTPPLSLLILFGPALLVAALFSAWTTRHENRVPGHTAAGTRPSRAAWYAALAATLAVAGLLGLREPTLAILAGLGAALGWAGWRLMARGGKAEAAPATIFCWLLMATSVAILVIVELVYLSDAFGTRMNTVFKLHYNAWILFGIGGAAALGLIWQASARSGARGSWGAVASATAILVTLPGLVYPLAATWTKSGGFRAAPTLDGERFLRVVQAADHAGIEWLRANTAGRPVIVEAVGPDYGEHARVSTFSGLPTVLGWVGHELQWRGPLPDYGRRQQDVEAVYRAETLDEIRARAAPYRARFLFFGQLERSQFGDQAEARLNRLLPIAYARQGTVVYTLPSAGQDGPPR